MSSFVRNRNIKKRKTGIPILDSFIDTLEDGSLILIKEDEYSYIHTYLLNIFMSEGIHENEKELLTVSKDGTPEIYARHDSINDTQEYERMFIAWRYKDLRINKEECKYSLTSKLEIKHDCLFKQDVTLDSLLKKLENIKNHRISIHSLFSPSYEANDLQKWMYKIRKTIRNNNHICMISIPTYLYPDVNFNQFFDIVISLDCNIFTGYLPNYKSILFFEKITFPSKIRENNTDTFKFGLKFVKNRLIIEKIDIPPEDIEMPSNGCNSF